MNHEGPCTGATNDCEKTTRYGQIASMVVEEGGEAHTINLCQQCYNEKVGAAGQTATEIVALEKVVEKKAHRGRLWEVMGSEQFLRGMWDHFTLQMAGTRKF